MASSSAVTMTCGSMPFSLAIASMCCINGLVVICLGTLRIPPPKRPRANDVVQADPRKPFPSAFQHERVVFHAPEAPFEMHLAVDGLANDHLGHPPAEPFVVAAAAQRAFQAGRRNLEGIGAIQRILDVENRAQILAHALAVCDPDAVVQRLDHDPALGIHWAAGRASPAAPSRPARAGYWRSKISSPHERATRSAASRIVPDRASSFSRCRNRVAQTRKGSPKTKKVGTGPLGHLPLHERPLRLSRDLC